MEFDNRHIKDVISFLEKDKLKEQLSKVWKEFVELTGQQECSEDEDLVGLLNMDEVCDEYLYTDYNINDAQQLSDVSLRDTFQDYVIKHFEEPVCVTVEELEDAFIDVIMRRDLDFETIYSLFMGNILAQSITLTSKSFPISPVTYGHDPQNVFDVCNGLKWSKNGISFCLWKRNYRLYGTLSGYMSNNVCDTLVNKLSQVLSTIIKNAVIINKLPFLEIDGSIKAPSINKTSLENNIITSIGAYFCKPTKKDTFNRRIRNALHLLTEADIQHYPGIGLALSFAAIEALVCSKKDGITEELARNIATLLEPDSGRRMQVIKYVKDLYNIRSKLLHGERIETESIKEKEVRYLAGACLTAILGWSTFHHKVGNEENIKVPDFFSELEEAKVSGREMVGIPQSCTICQWHRLGAKL